MTEPHLRDDQAVARKGEGIEPRYGIVRGPTGSRSWKATSRRSDWRERRRPRRGRRPRHGGKRTGTELGRPPRAARERVRPTRRPGRRAADTRGGVGPSHSTRSAGKPRTGGRGGTVSAAPGKHRLHTEGGKRCHRHWSASPRRVRNRGARCGKSARRVLRGEVAQVYCGHMRAPDLNGFHSDARSVRPGGTRLPPTYPIGRPVALAPRGRPLATTAPARTRGPSRTAAPA